jgi:hypothetical protein
MMGPNLGLPGSSVLEMDATSNTRTLCGRRLREKLKGQLYNSRKLSVRSLIPMRMAMAVQMSRLMRVIDYIKDFLGKRKARVRHNAPRLNIYTNTMISESK